MSLPDLEIDTLTGERRRLRDYQGKALLIVNVASKCGFTPQYEGLEALYRKYQPRGLEILGFPCNQFGHQEPGGPAEIASFCSANYDVTFPMFAKIDVNGAATHPLYRHLKEAAPGLLGSTSIKWNFTKFLIDPAGNVVQRFGPRDTPESLSAPIERLLPRAAA